MTFVERGSSFNFGLQEAARDEQLVSAIQAGSTVAFAELQTLYSRRLYRTIVHITKNREDAEDALQDTFLRAYLAVGHFERRSSFYSWLTRIAINSAFMVLRKRRARAGPIFESVNGDQDGIPTPEIRDHSPDPEQLCSQRQLYNHLSSAIQRLEPILRQPIEMQLTRECTIKELARTLEISVTAVKSRLYRARRRLAAAQEFKRLGVRKHLLTSPSLGWPPSNAGIEGRHV